MWALGVVLFTMLYGQFPFYDSIPQELFRKIKAAEFSIPEWVSPLSFCALIGINCWKMLIGKYCDGPCLKGLFTQKWKTLMFFMTWHWMSRFLLNCSSRIIDVWHQKMYGPFFMVLLCPFWSLKVTFTLLINLLCSMEEYKSYGFGTA